MALLEATIEYSSSTNSDSVSVIFPVWDVVSFTPLFDKRNVVFSSVTPPVDVAMFVVLFPSVRLPESDMSQSPPIAPTSVHVPIALQLVIFSPYSRRYCTGDEEVAPSLETSRRMRLGTSFAIARRGESSFPPVADVARASVLSSFLK